MSETQKEWVSIAGFGPLLSFALEKIPKIRRFRKQLSLIPFGGLIMVIQF